MSKTLSSSGPSQQSSNDILTSHDDTAGQAPSAASRKGNVELNNIPAATSGPPLEEDIMQLARLGEVAAIRTLFEKGRFTAQHTDEEGITPLHWAAINNQYALCKYLLEAGADVNAKGGESVATPAMWAAQRSHYYVVNLLLQHGADPLLTDIQGYNVLHLATFTGNLFLLLLLLHQNIPVDVADPAGHTSLMWAAYKGFPTCVDLFLRWGANVYATDDQGFTALHWALVKGPEIVVSQMCVQKVIEYGSDRFAESSTGKTPAIIAEEMKCTGIWYAALAECGYDEGGNTSRLFLPLSRLVENSRSFFSRFIFLWPFVIIFVVLWILSRMVVFAALPLAAFIAYGLQWVAVQSLQWAPTDLKQMHRTPFFAGVFAGTCFWTGVQWLTVILPMTYAAMPFTHLAFAILYGLCSYFYYCTMTYDPGYVPRLRGRNLERLPELSDAQCNILSDALCGIYLKDPFTIVLTILVALQLSWITMLMFVQLVQIARAQTTLENMRGVHHSDHKLPEALTATVTAGSMSLEGAQLTSTDTGPDVSAQHRHSAREGLWPRWKKLLGLDTFVATAQDGLRGRERRQRQRNPFSRGMVTNCRDFWCDPAPWFGPRVPGSAMLGGHAIDYTRMYETPPRMRVWDADGSQAVGTYQAVASREDV
ncbi:MAG: palmitoyltransferase akr1 [Caeruleum heppii]|nr:MAG: palmitoyltransferase akr1 [Caeruleum heppii]